MIYSEKLTYIFILVIIVTVLFIANRQYFFPLYEGNAPGPAEANEQAAVIDNKELTGDINQASFNTLLQDVDSKIQACNNIIRDINSKIPMSINDILIQSVNQVENVNDVSINITQSSDPKKSISSITGAEIETAIWNLTFNLPSGKKGPIGEKGPQGVQGPPGKPGAQGSQGDQGPWADCNDCK
jgi:hypothetical protein